jgi:hypothetical protein
MSAQGDIEFIIAVGETIRGAQVRVFIPHGLGDNISPPVSAPRNVPGTHSSLLWLTLENIVTPDTRARIIIPTFSRYAIRLSCLSCVLYTGRRNSITLTCVCCVSSRYSFASPAARYNKKMRA